MNITENGGAALVIGFLAVLLVLYRDPVSGLDVATDSIATVVFFVVLPVAGILAGVYAYIGGPYSGFLLFLLGSYLGVFGIAVTLGSILGPNLLVRLLAIGIGLFSLSLVALMASILLSTAAIRYDSLRSLSNGH